MINIIEQQEEQNGLMRLGKRVIAHVGIAAMGLAAAIAISPVAPAEARPESFADLAAQVSDSVVNITTTTTVEQSLGPRFNVPEGSPFEDFFREFNERGNRQERRRPSNALGSGFVISEDGYIVTNNHVIQQADSISVEFFSGQTLDAELIGADPETDIALLKVESSESLPFVRFGDSDTARVGDWVMAVGNPLGQGFSVSAGIVSQRERALSGTYDDYIQTDAAINKGNSGGPLFNMEGEVIGVNTAILSPTGGSIGIGFSMASNVVTRVVDQLREFGETRRGWLGVSIQDVDSDMAEALGLEEVRGALVSEVPEGPAADAGILPGDIILSFDGSDIEDTRDLIETVGATEVGKQVRVIVSREGENQSFLVELGRRETAAAAGGQEGGPQTRGENQEAEILGMTLRTLNGQSREEFEISDATEQGLVITDIDEVSDAFEKGLRIGDVITEAGQESITNLDEFNAQLDQAREAGRRSLLLLIEREGRPRFLAISLEEN